MIKTEETVETLMTKYIRSAVSHEEELKSEDGFFNREELFEAHVDEIRDSIANDTRARAL